MLHLIDDSSVLGMFVGMIMMQCLFKEQNKCFLMDVGGDLFPLPPPFFPVLSLSPTHFSSGKGERESFKTD